MNYDKKRITSTIILGIFITLALIIIISFLGFNQAYIDEAMEQMKESNEDAGAQIAGGFALALVLAIGLALVFIAYIACFIDLCICLPFCLANRKSTLKPIRIISYVYDGLCGAGLLITIIKLITLFAMGS